MRPLAFLAVPLLMTITVGASHKTVVANAHKTTHKINMSTITGGGSCSSTAVAPHVLLTASHCEAPSDQLLIDGTTVVTIEGILRDDNDHSLFLLGGVTFADYAQFGPEMEQSDEVFILGNPGGLVDAYRKGTVSMFIRPGAGASLLAQLEGKALPTLTLIDMNGFFGDSGSALFDEDGRIVGVTSVVKVLENNGVSLKFMGSYSFGFTDKQLLTARTYGA